MALARPRVCGAELGETSIETVAVILRNPGAIELGSVPLDDPGPDDIVVEIAHTGISTGTEKLFWSGTMPPFPGMGYPLIPGYEAVGEVVQAGAGSVAAHRRHGLRAGRQLLRPGARAVRRRRPAAGHASGPRAEGGCRRSAPTRR